MKKPFDAERFLNDADWRGISLALAGVLMDVAFFMKDREGRFVMQNRRACEFCNVADESETLGKTDADFWDAGRASLYTEGDQAVVRTGEPIINQLAPAPEEAGSDNMVLYSKFPVRNRKGNIIGVAGIHRLCSETPANPSPLGSLHRAIRHIHEHYAQEIKMGELARTSGLSPSQFTRKFNCVLGMSPQKYLIRVRVRNACRFLEETNATVSTIAQECGFFDHAHFSRAFLRIMGTSPSDYRKAHRKA